MKRVTHVLVDPRVEWSLLALWVLLTVVSW